mmetsp:Transcript_11724/g.27507  ORF Transcript_11724/g.27507 Transcript_11724/m.27507 type:complete len:333 (+) Transcript_11724:166-1164(+)
MPPRLPYILLAIFCLFAHQATSTHESDHVFFLDPCDVEGFEDMGLASCLKTQGYAKLRKALSTTKVNAMRDRAEHVFSGAEGGLIVGKGPKPGMILRSLANVPPTSAVAPFLSIMETLSSNVASALNTTVEFAGHADLHVNTTKTWHRDIHSGQYDQWKKHGTWEARLFRVVIYLEDHSNDNGALLVVPGSHLQENTPRPKNGPKADQEAQTNGILSLRPSIGDALIIDHRTYHRGGDVFGLPGPRHLVQYSFGEPKSPFTENFGQTNTGCVKRERKKCPVDFVKACVCFDYFGADDKKSCGNGGCGRCGKASSTPRAELRLFSDALQDEIK